MFPALFPHYSTWFTVVWLPPPLPSRSGGISSDDFVSFMEGLQSQRNVIMDLSKSVSTGTYNTPEQSNSEWADAAVCVYMM